MVERQQEKEEGSLETNDNWISRFLSSKDPDSCKRDSPSGFPWTGQGGGDRGSPRRAAALQMPAGSLAFIFLFSSRDRGVGRSPPPAFPPGRTSGSWKQILRRSGAGASGAALLGRMAPQEVRAFPPQAPAWPVSTAELS